MKPITNDKTGHGACSIPVLARTVQCKTTKPNVIKRQTGAAVASSTVIELDLAAPGNSRDHIFIISDAAAIGSKVTPALRAFWVSLTPPSADAEHIKNLSDKFSFGPDQNPLIDSRKSFDNDYALRGEATESRMTNCLTRI